MTDGRGLIEALGDSIAVLGIRDTAQNVACDISALAQTHLDRARQHPNWPTGLNPRGVPFEFSIAIDQTGTATVRVVVDATDHRFGLAGNWSSYLSHAQLVTGTAPDQFAPVHDLIARHLDGIPPLFRSRVMHGAGYGPSNRRRGTLYFATRWMSYPQFRRRFRESAERIEVNLGQSGRSEPADIHMMSYDFTYGHANPDRTKLYLWLDANLGTKQLLNLIAGDSDLEAAGAVIQHFLAAGPVDLPPYALLWQLSYGEGASSCREKLMFHCSRWGWEEPAGLASLLSFLSGTLGLNLWQLDAVLRVFAIHGIRLWPSFVAIGPSDPQPAVTFYFCPALDELPMTDQFGGAFPMRSPAGTVSAATSVRGDDDAETAAQIDAMIERGVAYLFAARDGDGHWTDFALDEPDVWVDFPIEGPSDEWVTAYITAVLASAGTRCEQLRTSAEWLKSRYRPGEGWGWSAEIPPDAESTALALLALRRLDAEVPSDALATLHRFRLPDGGYRAYRDWALDDEHGAGVPDVTAVAVQAELEVGGAPGEEIDASITALLRQQRNEGGWNAFWWKDDLVATNRVVHAFAAFVAHIPPEHENVPGRSSTVKRATRAIERARPSLSAQVVRDEAFLLGVWLSTWFAAARSLSHPSVRRAALHLSASQQADGRWLTAPARRIAETQSRRPWARSDSGKMFLDRRCCLTTATVVDGLVAVRDAIRVHSTAG